jgi:hypothetical protein
VKMMKVNTCLSRESPLDSLLNIYKKYWRLSLLAPDLSHDSLLRQNLSLYLSNIFRSTNSTLGEDSLHLFLIKYVMNRGFKTTGFGKTGKLYDLLLWQHQKDTVFTFKLQKEIITTPVVFMEKFISLGWEEYATADRAYPGGWAKHDTLYCVKKAYNIHSENFLISYLAHEGMHFSDYRKFPGLNGQELEYRAKLIELSMLKDNLFRTLEFFIVNADQNSANAHSSANFMVVQNLSRKLFKNDFEVDMSKWQKVGLSKIHRTSYKLLLEDTKALKNKKAKI